MNEDERKVIARDVAETTLVEGVDKAAEKIAALPAMEGAGALCEAILLLRAAVLECREAVDSLKRPKKGAHGPAQIVPGPEWIPLRKAARHYGMTRYVMLKLCAKNGITVRKLPNAPANTGNLVNVVQMKAALGE